MLKEIVVLRYGHRHVRDYRVTSHCCLVARAFGVGRIEIEGKNDRNISETLRSINDRWGQGAESEFIDTWKSRLEHYKKNGFTSVHLTMYGIPIEKVENALRKKDKILVIIGSQKVEREVYEKSDYNVSVTLQPHSEIAALAVFLDRLFEGKELSKKFPGAKIAVEPADKGKKIRKLESQ